MSEVESTNIPRATPIAVVGRLLDGLAAGASPDLADLHAPQAMAAPHDEEDSP